MNAPSPIPFADLRAQYRRLKAEIAARMAAVFEHGQFIMGPEVGEFERALADHVGCRHVVGVASGTDALLIALMAEGVGRGDAVFVPVFTFTATAEAVLLLGATPVFVDVDPRRFNIDAADLERRIAGVKRAGRLRPRAVIAVDLFGLPADYRRLRPLCRNEGLLLIADAAQSLGGALDNRRVGTLAEVTATSFFPSKPLGCYGDGGALMTDDEERAERYRSIRQHGKGGGKYDIVRLGLNSRLDTLQAAVLLAKLPHLAAEIEVRGRLAAHYEAALGALVETPLGFAGAESAWAQYSVLLNRRDAAAAALKARGVPTMIYYPRPMHLQPAYEAFGEGPGSCPVAESLCGRILSLPMHPDMDAATAARICAAVEDALREAA